MIAVSTPVAPPMMRTVTFPPRVIVPVRLRIMPGNQVLLDDTLRLARGSSASFTQSRTEAPARFCEAEGYYGAGERQSLNVSLYLRGETNADPQVNVSVSWQRPSGTAACGAGSSRSVSLSESVTLAQGQSATVRGDAGLVVTLSRR
jgi:hypothetical protein